MKNSLKKIVALLLCAVLVLAFAACGSKDNGETTEKTDKTSEEALNIDLEKEYKIGIIQFMPHPSLDNCRTGIENALKESGIKCDPDVQIGSPASAAADCQNFASTMVAKEYDVIFAIATPAAMSAFAATENTDIPVIFCAVSDPVSAKLVNSLEEPGYACTGTADVLDLEAQVDIIQAMQPDAKTIGVLYTSSEPNSITQLGLLKDICEKRGLAVESEKVQNASDIPAAATTLAEKVDCINNFTDNNVVENLSVVLEAADKAGIPVYGSEEEQVKNGCLASASIDYVALGEATGEMGLKALSGADISKMPVLIFDESSPVFNSDVLARYNLTLPEAYANAATVVTNGK